ncbi:MFS transporter [Lentzea sp. NPDC051838]|uniref:MFS transporter n=1 Tax=Lentzea sp. NPDC051838 TaxID=3154849 RepID=UPI0034150678
MPRPLVLLLIALLGMFTVQHLLAPTLGPLSLQLDLTGSQLGLVFTVASVSVTVASPLWGLALDAFGLRPVLAAGLGLSLVGLAGFAAASTLVADETLTPELTFVLALVFRSFLVGAGIAVLPVAALAVAGTTHEAWRTTAVGVVGAVQGLAGVIGPFLGGVLAIGSLLVPLFVAPAIALVLLIAVLVAVQPGKLANPQPMVRTQPGDLARVFGIGFLAHLALGLVSVAATLLAFDRRDGGILALTALAFVLGIGLVVTQGVLVPVLRWPADRLLRVGPPIAVAGCVILAAVPGTSATALALLVLAVGLGFALTGFAAAASLGVGPHRQGLVAGSVNATAGLSTLIGPAVGGALYSLTPVAPMIAAGVAAVLAAGLALMAPRVPQSSA